MSVTTVIDEFVTEMEIAFNLLDLLSGKGYHPFGGPQSYVGRVKDFYESLDESGQTFLKAMLVRLRDSEPSPRVITYYRRCVEERQYDIRQWLDRLNTQFPPDVMEVLSKQPTDEACKQDLKEQAAYALELLNENGS